jgi:iron(III) transport system substrate-binding protein
VPYGSAIPKQARHPNAARLWMDWNLSDEGQASSIRDQGNMTAMKNPPLTPDMYDAKVNKLWTPDFGPFQKLHDQWLEEWNKVYGYRQ